MLRRNRGHAARQQVIAPVAGLNLNHLFSAFVLIPFLWGKTLPTPPQLVVLFFFGAFQMSLPYWLVARSLRSVSPQEAGTITLLEPLLTPVWAYLVSPGTETPTAYTVVGGALILGALTWRYWPFRPAVEKQVSPSRAGSAAE